MILEIFAFVAFLITIGSFLWMARSDYRHLDAKIDSIKDLVSEMRLEMKDFHSRLCSIEERRKG